MNACGFDHAEIRRRYALCEALVTFICDHDRLILFATRRSSRRRGVAAEMLRMPPNCGATGIISPFWTGTFARVRLWVVMGDENRRKTVFYGFILRERSDGAKSVRNFAF